MVQDFENQNSPATDWALPRPFAGFFNKKYYVLLSIKFIDAKTLSHFSPRYLASR